MGKEELKQKVGKKVVIWKRDLVKELKKVYKPKYIELDEKLTPTLLALAIAIHDCDQFLVAICRRTHDHQHALPLVFRVLKSHVDINAVGPNIHIMLVTQIAAAPFVILGGALFLEADDHIGTESLGLLANQ